jgi:hypothetical protein
MFNQFNDLSLSRTSIFVPLSAACTSQTVAQEKHKSDDTTPVFVCQGVCVLGGGGASGRTRGKNESKTDHSSLSQSLILYHGDVYNIACRVGETEPVAV